MDACLKVFYDDLHVNDVLNIGSDVELTIKELAELIIKVTGSKSQVRHLPALKEGDMKRRLPDNSRMMSILGHPLLPLEEGLKKVIAQPAFILA